MTDEPLSWNRKPSRKGITPKGGHSGRYALKENQELWRANRGNGGALRTGPSRRPVQWTGYEAADVPDHATLTDSKPTWPLPRQGTYGIQAGAAPLPGPWLQKPSELCRSQALLGFYDPASPAGTRGHRLESTMGLHASFELRTRRDTRQGPLTLPCSGVDRLLRVHQLRGCPNRQDDGLSRTHKQGGYRYCSMGDHGWHLGDMGIWGKQPTMKSPHESLVGWAPDMPRGATTQALVNSSIFIPALRVGGLPTPTHCQGRSFVRSRTLINPGNLHPEPYPNPALRERPTLFPKACEPRFLDL